MKFNKSLILRIYGLTGRFINNPERFALGSFINQALKKQPIKIESKIPVIRGYGNAHDICKLALNWIFDENYQNYKEPISTVNVEIDLLSLAQKISEIYDLPKVNCSWDDKLKPNKYSCSSVKFIKELRRYHLKPKNIEEQILDTSSLFEENSGHQKR